MTHRPVRRDRAERSVRVARSRGAAHARRRRRRSPRQSERRRDRARPSARHERRAAGHDRDAISCSAPAAASRCARCASAWGRASRSPSSESDAMFAATGRLTDLICGTDAANAVWSPRQTVQSMLDVEAALARASAAHGVIPASAVGAIEAACHADHIDAAALMTGAAAGGNLAIPLVKQLTAVVKAADAEAAKYVHWGATSQDIIDTGTVLQLRATLDLHRRRPARPVRRARRSGEEASRHADDRPHLAAAGAADHAGPEVRAMARCADAPSRASVDAALARPGVAVRRRGGHAREPARQGAAGRADARRRTRPRDARAAVAHAARPHRGSGGVPGHADRHARQDRPRHLAVDADRSRRARGTGGGGQGRIVDDAAQAQPGRLRGGADRGDARAESRRDRLRGHGAGARTRARRLAGRVGSAAGPRAPDRRRARADEGDRAGPRSEHRTARGESQRDARARARRGRDARPRRQDRPAGCAQAGRARIEGSRGERANAVRRARRPTRP